MWLKLVSCRHGIGSYLRFTHSQGGRKVLCGNGEGALMIYNWGLWEDITDRYPTSPPHSIDSMTRVSDSVVCVGSMDGAIRWESSLLS